MEPGRFLRDAFRFSVEEFRSLCSSVREFVLLEAMNDAGKAQGLAVVRRREIYQADEEEAFVAAHAMSIGPNMRRRRTPATTFAEVLL